MIFVFSSVDFVRLKLAADGHVIMSAFVCSRLHAANTVRRTATGADTAWRLEVNHVISGHVTGVCSSAHRLVSVASRSVDAARVREAATIAAYCR